MRVHYLPKCTTSFLQPLDGGFISSIKKVYQRKSVERGVRLIEEGVTNDLYSVDMKQGMESMSDIWANLKNQTILNFWREVGLLE